MAVQDANDNTDAHVQDYSLFTGIMKWGTIVSLAVAFIVVLLIAN